MNILQDDKDTATSCAQLGFSRKIKMRRANTECVYSVLKADNHTCSAGPMQRHTHFKVIIYFLAASFFLSNILSCGKLSLLRNHRSLLVTVFAITISPLSQLLILFCCHKKYIFCISFLHRTASAGYFSLSVKSVFGYRGPRVFEYSFQIYHRSLCFDLTFRFLF